MKHKQLHTHKLDCTIKFPFEEGGDNKDKRHGVAVNVYRPSSPGKKTRVAVGRVVTVTHCLSCSAKCAVSLLTHTQDRYSGV